MARSDGWRDSRSRAIDALARLASAPDALDDPLVVSAYHALRRVGVDVDPRPLLNLYARRQPHYGRVNAMRYRWNLSWRAEPGSRVYANGTTEAIWRPAERERLAADATKFGRRLVEPVALASHLAYWGELEDDGAEGDLAERARSLLEEALPTMEHEVSSWFAAEDPWRDTFGLWLLSGEPNALARLRDVVFSLAIRYGGIAARNGLVQGTQFPFHREPLVSASAHLALGLWRLGVYPSVIPGLLAHLERGARPDGGWSDGAQPSDVLTTLAAAQVRTILDPAFDPEPTVDWLVRHQEPAGWWRALNPEVPWLTSAVVGWLDRSSMPFSERFQWPTSPVWARDRLTGLTTMATLDEIAVVLEGLPALGGQQLDVAFLDLAGFGTWNSLHGQARGDDVLRLLGSALGGLPGCLPVRIGGDEFLILGKPGDDGLVRALDTWRAAWPGTLAAGDIPAAVAPRILVGRAPAREIRSLGRVLGDGISGVKGANQAPPPDGVLTLLAK
jgi:hypothetical protein